MKSVTLVALLAIFLPIRGAFADGPPADPFAGAFFPPELIAQAHEQAGLSQEQLEAFRAQVEKTQARQGELRQQLEREVSALATLAKQNRVDEAALLAQLDKVLAAEREVKHLHIGLLVAIKNLLTPEQQARLREIAGAGGSKLGEEMRKRIEAKVAQVEAGARKWAESGRDPSPIGQAMEEKVRPLMQAGNPVAVEAELDRVLEQFIKDAK